MIDLHTHSRASDGNLTPSALVAEAAKKGLTALALTDHDTVSGLEEGAIAAEKLGLRFIRGIELEITYGPQTPQNLRAGGEFHLLGLGLKTPSPGLKDAFAELARFRIERNQEIIEAMNEAGIPASFEEIQALVFESPTNEKKNFRAYIGRPHFALFLVKRKIVKNIEQAFTRYLGRGRPFYRPKIGLEFERATELIHESGGISVLAHPMSLYVGWGRLPDFIKNLKERGLDGLEAWHPAAKVSSCRRLEELGKTLNLRITAGSDFHGINRPDRKLGITAGGKKMDESFLEALDI